MKLKKKRRKKKKKNFVCALGHSALDFCIVGEAYVLSKYCTGEGLPRAYQLST